MQNKVLLFILMTLMTQLAGCGGGGGGGTSVPATRSAVVTLSSAGALPSGSQIGIIDITLNLPAGVTVQAAPSTLNAAVLVPASGVIVLKGGAAAAASQSLFVATYLPGTPNKVVIKLISAAGLAPNDLFAAVNCDIAAGSNPVPADFSVSANVPPTGVSDLSGPLPGVNVQFSVAFN